MIFSHLIHNLHRYFHFYKYDILLFALLQHLFVGTIIYDLDFYIKYVWPANMIVLGIASNGVFIEKEKWKRWLKNIFLILIMGFPMGLWFENTHSDTFMQWLNITYFLFFLFILYEVFIFLIKPSYINLDIITAAGCGYLLLIELATFTFQYHFYENPLCFSGVQHTNPADTFSSFVYFSSVTITSIGFGDIRPSMHYTKLITSFFGILGQFYSVVLIGILIGKFSDRVK